MTSLLEGAKRLVSGSSDLGPRVAGLEAAVANARGRLDDVLVDSAEEMVERTHARLRLSAEHTVIAIAGATGSGKSSTFNAVTGLELSAVGVRRPTTSWATACVWGDEGAGELLEFLGIPARHQTTRDSMLDTGKEDRRFHGTVLLDLPDHDSTELSHHLEVDRLVKLADVLLWIVDPQKYADAALHERYLRKLARHSAVMVVALNHIDTVPVEQRDAMLADVRRLMANDGLPDVPVLAISARFGDGMEELKDELAARVASKKATRTRLESDIRAAAGALAAESGTGRPQAPPRERLDELEDAFADAAGVPVIVETVADSTRVRARRATGWPLTSWISRLRPDPLKKLQLDLGGAGAALSGRRRVVPEVTPVQGARIDASVRSLADEVSALMTPPWRTSIRAAATSRTAEVTSALDRALAGVDLGARGLPWWAHLVRLLQWLLILAALTGAIWLAVGAFSSATSGPWVDPADVLGVPLPLVLLIGGVGLGLVLALLARAVVGMAARSRARSAERSLRRAIRTVCDDLVVKPIESELNAYEAVRSGLNDALR
ncbi:GTPase [Nocardioides daejeonensis]|uniref:GTPase n=1 Tax=Nocardioides daejeonensis TaxID=1046556 RepID=UPI000D7487E5|nr:GTPase [Nocardioides daejeonensis]